MATPTPGEICFAELLLKTERKPRFDVDAVWEKIFSSAVVVTFIFFLFM